MTGSHAKAYGSYLEYLVEWTATARIPTNTSDVTVNVYLSHYAISISGKSISCTVNGTTKSAVSAALSQSSKTKTKSLLASFSFSGVAHANDGSLSCGISSTWSCGLTYSGTYYASMSVSGTLTGDKIPRASSISSLSTNVEINGTNSLSVGISRAVSSYTHTVKFVFGTKSRTTTGVDTGTSFVIPMDWLEAIPNAAAGIGSCTVTTYSGSTAVGSVSKNFTLLCPSFVAPTMEEPAVTRINNTVPSAWGVYLQNVSGVKLQAVGAAGVYGSTIKAYRITCAGYTADAASLLVNKIPQSGELAFTVTATDTRGRSVTKTGEITVQPYTAPTVSGLTLFRCNSSGNRLETGTYVSVKADISYTVIGENALTVTCQVMDSGVIYTESLLNSTPKVIGPISTDRAYQIKISASDLFSSSERYSMISSTRYYMHFKKGGGRGVAFGKAAEHDNTVEISDDMDFMLMGKTMRDFVVESGKSGIWFYIIWASGLRECWGRIDKTLAVNTAYGNGYYNGSVLYVAPPDGLFSGDPDVWGQVRPYNAQIYEFALASVQKTSIAYYITSDKIQSSGHIYISLYARQEG